MTSIDALAEQMKAAALKATPGPWSVNGFGAVVPTDHVKRPTGGAVDDAYDRDHYAQEIAWPDDDRHGRGSRAANASHISASNPANVLAVLKDRDALKAQLEDVATERDAWQMEFEGGSEVAGARLAALVALLKEAEDVLKPFADIVGPFRAATEAGRHYIPDEAFRRVTPLLSRIAAVQKTST